jgi:hypothetical protein
LYTPQVVTYTLETMVQGARKRGGKLQQDLQAVADEDDPGKGLGLGLEQAPTRQKRKTAKGAAASKDLDEMNELLMVAPVAVKPATAPKAAPKASSAPRMSPRRVEAEATRKVAKAAPPPAASAITLEVGGPARGVVDSPKSDKTRVTPASQAPVLLASVPEEVVGVGEGGGGGGGGQGVAVAVHPTTHQEGTTVQQKTSRKKAVPEDGDALRQPPPTRIKTSACP